MMHVKQIKTLIEKGDAEQASDAIENLLLLGPKNTEALKLKATMLHAAGLYDDEFKVWERVLDVDREDEDCIAYFQKRFMEEQERFYFVDEHPQTGKTFFAYPRHLIKTSSIGLLGCTLFLLIPLMTQQSPSMRDPVVVLSCFTLLVIVPWLGIIRSFFKSLKSINMSDKGLILATRTRQTPIPWNSVKGISLVQGSWESASELFLLIEVNAAENSPSSDDSGHRIVIDMAEETSNVKARPHFLKELKRHFPQMQHMNARQIPTAGGKLTYL